MLADRQHGLASWVKKVWPNQHTTHNNRDDVTVPPMDQEGSWLKCYRAKMEASTTIVTIVSIVKIILSSVGKNIDLGLLPKLTFWDYIAFKELMCAN